MHTTENTLVNKDRVVSNKHDTDKPERTSSAVDLQGRKRNSLKRRPEVDLHNSECTPSNERRIATNNDPHIRGQTMSCSESATESESSAGDDTVPIFSM